MQLLKVAFVLHTAFALAQAFPQSGVIGLRQIVLSSDLEATQVRDALTSGASFESLAAQRSRDATANRGGYMGSVRPTDLLNEVRTAVEALRPGEVSKPIRVGDTFVLFQVVPEAERKWIEQDEAGAEALARGQNADAVLHYEQALDLAEKNTLGDARFARSLDSLAMAYRFVGKSAESERLSRRALALLERMGAPDIELAQVLSGLGKALVQQAKFEEAGSILSRALSIREKGFGPNHPEVAATLNLMAEVSSGLGRFAEATALYDRSLEMLVKSLGSSDPATVAATQSREVFRQSLIAELLDRLSTLISLAEFRDRDFTETMKGIHELLALTPLSEHSFEQMKDILADARLYPETEEALRTGLARFPSSLILRMHLANLLADTGRTQDSLALLQEMDRMPKPDDLDPVVEREQRAVIQQRIGDMQLALSRLEPALAAYRRSLEIDPGAPSGRLKLGRAYIAANRLDDARAELERATRETPDDTDARLSLAEVLLALGQWELSAAAAQSAIDLGASDPRALYLSGTAQIRMGKVESGRERLAEFARVEQRFQEATARNRDIDSVNLNAARALRDGDGNAAVQQLLLALARYPDAAALELSLATALSRTGQHLKAIEILESLLERKAGRGFLIHKTLAEEYAVLGNSEVSGVHRRIYLETREAELGAK